MTHSNLVPSSPANPLEPASVALAKLYAVIAVGVVAFSITHWVLS